MSIMSSAAGSFRRSGTIWRALPGGLFLIFFFLVTVARILGLSFENAGTPGFAFQHYYTISEY
ncbi:hypothetical protein BKM77_15270 [Pseudomonas syringae]|nr:hypothetical protein CXB38_00210 [Pseudomonas syringae]RXF63944.1 hypothetical protein BKM77_15270 [Pseudomonas syringae]